MLEKLKTYFTIFITWDKIKRSSGEEVILDLEKFKIIWRFKNNPYLKNDDVLIFPPYDMDKNFFTINGAVNRSGKYSFVEGDELSTQ